jgi:pimeloyl-ACP methyl ester carboxylesterase
MAYVIAESERVPAAVWKGALAGLMDYNAAEHQIRVPAMVLGGDCDGVFSTAEHEDLARRIPGATSQIFKGIGHALHWEDPEAFAKTLLTMVAA